MGTPAEAIPGNPAPAPKFETLGLGVYPSGKTVMSMIKIKSVYSAIDRKGDGFRILATRIRGRGLKASRYDAWMANLAPTESLLVAGRAGRITWAEFARRYRKELKEKGSIDARNRNIKNHGQKFTLRMLQQLGRRQNVTIMCHCDENEKQCHRHILKKILNRKIT